MCLSVDSEDGTLLAVDTYTNKLNSIDWKTGDFTPVMDVSNITSVRLGDGYAIDSERKIIYSLAIDYTPTMDSIPSAKLADQHLERKIAYDYTNVLNVINYREKVSWNHTISCQYKIGDLQYDPLSDMVYGMEYEAGWLLKDQPTTTTIYIGRINRKTWTFERLGELKVPFFSDDYNFLTTFCASRGHYVFAWPQPDYDPYNRGNNGVLQVVDVRASPPQSAVQ